MFEVTFDWRLEETGRAWEGLGGRLGGRLGGTGRDWETWFDWCRGGSTASTCWLSWGLMSILTLQLNTNEVSVRKRFKMGR